MRKDIKILTVFAICLLISTAAFSGCHPRKLPIFKQVAEEMDEQATQNVRRLIEEVPEYKELNRICQEIPLPNDFNLVVMKASINKIGISYYYKSKTDFDTTEKDFRKYFSDNQWKELDNSELVRINQFSKGDYGVEIQYGDVGNADYSIHCEKLSSSDE